MTPPWMPARPAARAALSDFEAAARQLNVTVPEIKAVWAVEAAGRPFRADGSVERRFEPHHFPREHWATIGFSIREGEAPWRASLRLSSEAMFQRAYRIDPESALRATSWGAPQIMGFNHEDTGFMDARSMVERFSEGEAEQLQAFVTLIYRWGLASAIRAHDWDTFARRYNGPGQVREYAQRLRVALVGTQQKYRAAKLAKAYRHEAGAPSRRVLRLGDQHPDVKILQAALMIPVDGIFGRVTERAVRNFQRENGLVQDGVVGARTWAALPKSVSDKVSAAPESLPVSVETAENTLVATGLAVFAGLTYGVGEGVSRWAAIGVVVAAVLGLGVLRRWLTRVR